MKKYPFLLSGVVGIVLFTTPGIAGAEESDPPLSEENKRIIEEKTNEVDQMSPDELPERADFGIIQDEGGEGEFGARNFRELATATSNISRNLLNDSVNTSSATERHRFTSTITATNNMYYELGLIQEGSTERATFRGTVSSSNTLNGVAPGLYESRGVHTATNSGSIFSGASGASANYF